VRAKIFLRSRQQKVESFKRKVGAKVWKKIKTESAVVILFFFDSNKMRLAIETNSAKCNGKRKYKNAEIWCSAPNR